MQLVCQRNSLNLRSFIVQEIAELSEILTVQQNTGGALVPNRLCRSNEKVWVALKTGNKQLLVIPKRR